MSLGAQPQWSMVFGESTLFESRLARQRSSPGCLPAGGYSLNKGAGSPSPSQAFESQHWSRSSCNRAKHRLQVRKPESLASTKGRHSQPPPLARSPSSNLPIHWNAEMAEFKFRLLRFALLPALKFLTFGVLPLHLLPEVPARWFTWLLHAFWWLQPSLVAARWRREFGSYHQLFGYPWTRLKLGHNDLVSKWTPSKS